MAAAPLPGQVFLNADKYAFAPYPPTLAQILDDTLGNQLQEGDDIAQRAQELSDLMDAFTADVTSDQTIDGLPDGSIFHGTIAALTALGIEVDADTVLEGASAALDSLAGGIAVWNIFNVLVEDIIATFNQFGNWVIGLFESVVGAPVFGGPPSGPF